MWFKLQKKVEFSFLRCSLAEKNVGKTFKIVTQKHEAIFKTFWIGILLLQKRSNHFVMLCQFVVELQSIFMLPRPVLMKANLPSSLTQINLNLFT